MPARGPSRAFRLILFLAAGCWAFFCVVGFITTTWFQRVADERLALSSRSGRSSGRVASLLAPKLPPPPDWDVPPKWASDRFHGPSPESSYRLVSNATIQRLLRVARSQAMQHVPEAVTLHDADDSSHIAISPLLFGGFIEHMGRVIDGNHGNDGGLLAQLLADRKFYHPIVKEEHEATSGRGASVESKTRSPWRFGVGRMTTIRSPMAEAAGAVLSPLVRGGRHVSFRFACDIPRHSASPFVPGAEAVEQAVEPWTGEIEQSGLPLEEGRAYRGHVWVAARRSGPIDDGADREQIAVEVWLRYLDLDATARPTLARPALLARVTGIAQDENVKDEGGDNDDSNGHVRGPRNATIPLNGTWRRFDFGFVAAADTRVDCGCGVDSEGRADCAGDCRRGDGRGGFNRNNRNGAPGGLGEDVLGYCGECGAAVTLRVRRIGLDCRSSSTSPSSMSSSPSSIDSDNPTSTTTTTSSIVVGIGAISLVPVDAIAGLFRRDTVTLLRSLRSSILRWPGGNFVSGYNWRDGIGPVDERPPRKNAAWAGTVSNDFGVHEFMLLCGLLDAEPLIVVNAGLGSALDAAALVSYVNTPVGRMLNDADDESPKDVEEAPVKNNVSLSSTNAVMQKSAVAELLSPALIQKVMRDEPRRRSSNGAIAPWGCEWWGVGNEAYGEWQLGYVPIRGFLWKHRRFARAMKRVSPSIQVIAVGAQHVAATDSTNRSRGDEQQQVVSLDAKGRYGFDVSWTGRVMRELWTSGHSAIHHQQSASLKGHKRTRAVQTVAAISEHFYVDNERPTAAQHAKQMSWRIERFAATYRSLHSELQEYLFQRLNHKDRQSLRPPPSLLFAHEPMPGIVLDEYGYWYGAHEYGQLGTRSSLKDGLGVAVAMHAMMRNADIYTMATYSQSINVFGAIKTSKLGAAVDPVGLVLALLSEHFGFIEDTYSHTHVHMDGLLARMAAPPGGCESDDENDASCSSRENAVAKAVHMSLRRSKAHRDASLSRQRKRHRGGGSDHPQTTTAAVVAPAKTTKELNERFMLPLDLSRAPRGYAAGHPDRQIDVVSTLSSDRRILTVSAVNLYDDRVATLRFNDLTTLDMRPSTFFSKASPPTKHTHAHSYLVARCQVYADACLLDTTSQTTFLPSCPDHTALNRPATKSSGSSPRRGDVSNGRAPDMLSVRVTDVPPEWLEESRIKRFVKRQISSPLSLRRQAPPTHPAPENEKNNNRGWIWWFPRKRQAFDEQQKQSTNKTTPNATVESSPRNRTDSSKHNGDSSQKSGGDTTDNAAGFHFFETMTLLPLSVTVCEIRMELVGESEEVVLT